MERKWNTVEPVGLFSRKRKPEKELGTLVVNVTELQRRGHAFILENPDASDLDLKLKMTGISST